MAETPYEVKMSEIIDQLQYRIERLTLAKMDFERVASVGAVKPELAAKNKLDLDRITQSLNDANKAKEILQESCCQVQWCTFTLNT